MSSRQVCYFQTRPLTLLLCWPSVRSDSCGSSGRVTPRRRWSRAQARSGPAQTRRSRYVAPPCGRSDGARTCCRARWCFLLDSACAGLPVRAPRSFRGEVTNDSPAAETIIAAMARRPELNNLTAVSNNGGGATGGGLGTSRFASRTSLIWTHQLRWSTRDRSQA